MLGTGAHRSWHSSPANRFVVILSTSHQQVHTRSSDDPRKTYTASSKLRVIPSAPFGTRIHSKPTLSPAPSQAHLQLKRNPSLKGLGRDSGHAKRLSTPVPLRKRQPLQMKKAIVNWVTNKKRALLTSVLASSETLYGFLDKELNLSMQEVERPPVLAQLSPLNTVGLKVNLSSDNLADGRKRKSSIETERKSRKSMGGSRPTTKAALEKIPFKEACRNRDWMPRAKEQLTKDWHKALRLSNGITMGYDSPSLYTYYLGKGNNHPLVKTCFKARGWARVTDEESMGNANLVWTQSKVKWLFKSYPVAELSSHTLQPPKSIFIACSVRLFPKNATDNKGKLVDVKGLGYDLVTQSSSFVQICPTLTLSSQGLRTHNKLEHNYHLTNKKTLFMSMRTYCDLTNCDLFALIPVTFHVKEGVNDPEFHRFLEHFHKIAKAKDTTEDEKRPRNIWIIKPGENTNRGTGITVCSTLDQIKAEISSYAICSVTGQKRTFILQKYIENPLLINKRKFDIRCYALVTSINGVLQGYFYPEGYLRTSCKEFSLKDIGNRYIHLTNDAVQKYAEEYGKFEAGNKMSYTDLQRYLDTHAGGLSVQNDIIPQIRRIVKTTFMATFAKLDAAGRQLSFEILGYDFMVDAASKVWLIEVNTNPCLELSSPLLARIIPAMLDNALRIAVDPYFPDTGRRPSTSMIGETLPENRFELVFSSLVEGAALRSDLGDRFSTLQSFDPALQDLPDDDEIEDEDDQSEEGC